MPIAYRPPQPGDVSALSEREHDKANPCWWVPHDPQLELVAVREDQVVAELRIVDRGSPEPSRRKGECEMRLVVARDHRGQGIGNCLFEQALTFAKSQNADRITATYFEDDEQADSEMFLVKRGFTPFERYHAMRLHLDNFHPHQWLSSILKATELGVALTTLDQIENSPMIRKQIYEMETRARVAQPFREVGAYVPPPYEAWEQRLATRPPEDIYLAIAGGRVVGVIKGLDDPFTGVDPEWQGQGIATALKVAMLTEAKSRGLSTVTTGNHEDNAPMLRINEKLGYIHDPVEVNCVLRL